MLVIIGPNKPSRLNTPSGPPAVFVWSYIVSTYDCLFIGRRHCRAFYPEVMVWPVQGANLHISGLTQVLITPALGGEFTDLRFYQVLRAPAEGVKFTDLRFYQVL